MNPKGCNSPSISWNITAAVVWSEVLVSIVSLLVGSKYSSNGALSNLFFEFVKCLLMLVFPFPLLILLCQLCQWKVFFLLLLG